MGFSQNWSLSGKPTVRNTFLKEACLSNCRHTHTHTHSYTHSVHSKGSHTQSGAHKNIHTHSGVLVWYGAQTVMTVSGPCVIEVMEAETGWGLSSTVSDRKQRKMGREGRRRGEGGGTTAEFTACSLSLCRGMCLSHVKKTTHPPHLWLHHLSLSYAYQSFPTFLSSFSHLSTCLSLHPPLPFFFFFTSLHGWGEDEICPFIPVSDTASRKTMGYP